MAPRVRRAVVMCFAAGGLLTSLDVGRVHQVRASYFLWQWSDRLLGGRPTLTRNDLNPHEASGGDDPLRPEPPLPPGRNPIVLLRRAESPYSSYSRQQKLLNVYIPQVREQFFALSAQQKKKKLGSWIPPLRELLGRAQVEKRVKSAIADQWAGELAPLQPEDDGKMKQFPELSASIDTFLYSSNYLDTNSSSRTWGRSPRKQLSEKRKMEIREVERTFAFGYELLRMCAVEKYESQFFQAYLETPYRERLEQTEELLRRLEAVSEDVGEERDQEALRHFARVADALEEDPVLGAFKVPDEGGHDDKSLAEAVKMLFNKPFPSANWNLHDPEQERTGNRLPMYPLNLTRSTGPLYLLRRDAIASERQKEDLKNGAAVFFRRLVGMFLPVAFLWSPVLYGGAQDDRGCLLAWVGNLNRTSQDDNKAIPDAVKQLAGAASQKLLDHIHAGDRMLSVFGKGGDPDSELAEEQDRDVCVRGRHYSKYVYEELIKVLERNLGHPCVRLMQWLRRHQVVGRATRWNLEARLRVLAEDRRRRQADQKGPTLKTPPEPIAGARERFERLLEREVPTAIGPGGPPQSSEAIPENPNYTNVFFLLKNNVEKKLEEVPALSFPDFDRWADEYGEDLVARTPHDSDYVPPWDRQNWDKWHEKNANLLPLIGDTDRAKRDAAAGRLPKTAAKAAWAGAQNRKEEDGEGGGEDEEDEAQEREQRRTQVLFNAAVAGIVVFTLLLGVVTALLVRECRLAKTDFQQKGSRSVGKEPTKQNEGRRGAGVDDDVGAPRTGPVQNVEHNLQGRAGDTRSQPFVLNVRDTQPQNPNNRTRRGVRNRLVKNGKQNDLNLDKLEEQSLDESDILKNITSAEVIQVGNHAAQNGNENGEGGGDMKIKTAQHVVDKDMMSSSSSQLPSAPPPSLATGLHSGSGMRRGRTTTSVGEAVETETSTSSGRARRSSEQADYTFQAQNVATLTDVDGHDPGRTRGASGYTELEEQLLLGNNIDRPPARLAAREESTTSK